MNPIEVLRPRKGYPPFRVNLERIENLSYGKQPELGVICRGMLEGAELICTGEA